MEKELDRELDKSDDVRRRRPKGDDVEYEPSSDDERWEKANKKPGSESLEPRRISVPLPGSEAQALTPANRKMIKRLDDKVELYMLHIKHYHMSPTQFSTSYFYVDSSSSGSSGSSSCCCCCSSSTSSSSSSRSSSNSSGSSSSSSLGNQSETGQKRVRNRSETFRLSGASVASVFLHQVTHGPRNPSK